MINLLFHGTLGFLAQEPKDKNIIYGLIVGTGAWKLPEVVFFWKFFFEQLPTASDLYQLIVILLLVWVIYLAPTLRHMRCFTYEVAIRTFDRWNNLRHFLLTFSLITLIFWITNDFEPAASLCLSISIPLLYLSNFMARKLERLK